ncbi:MAG: glycosyltransferase family 2 protein [Candidatus Omnitrophota bacterium]
MGELINIIIPVYNESEMIGSTLSEIKDKIKAEHIISIVYDFEEDNTLPAVEKFCEENKAKNIRVIKNKYGRGALNAIRSGFENIDQGMALIVMADFSDDLAAVDGMLSKIAEGYDIVCGSRYMRGGRQEGGPKFKKFLSCAAGKTLHYLIRIPTHDVTNSFKIYTKDVLTAIKIESNGGFELGMEIVIKAFLNGYRITEVPVFWRDREAGESRFKLWLWLPKYIWWYVYAVSRVWLGRKKDPKRKEGILCKNG